MRAPLRRPRTRLFAAAALAVAALSLTACDNDEGTRDEGAAKPTQSAGQQSGGTDGGASADSGANTGSSGSGGTSGSTGSSGSSGSATGGSGGTGGSGSSGKASAGASGAKDADPYAPANRVPCTAANTSVTATPVQRPLNYMLLTVTNTGSKMCDLKGYPRLQFEDAQSVPPVIEETKPQAVTSLKPGAKGYAGVILSAGDGSGGEGRTAQSLKVGFEGSDRMADAMLQAKGVHVDDKLRVTYWLSSSTDALN
ncbi:hypothetical protein GCM10018785_39480 [Streptomyces longispororuber]|uniref:DUF4232 domain-containing protein n=1 Tax=Streptomyces longispororuber TaxID=68230 RepID=A0A919DPL5_9ACTN|nr:DUF4232 domain-containing protein [Streptomyces longispororuber]GHE66792.1 hypothetical protein GCM10018785_39480 [Streptomyces longispororuber]